MSRLLDMLGCKYPIIQGPIGMLNSPDMVAAVSEAGGYGMLALGFVPSPDDVRRLVDEVRERTNLPFGANIMLTNPRSAEYLKILSDAGVRTVTTSVGNPADLYPRIHELGMKGLHVVLALSHAKNAVKNGADGIVMAGSEAGGLRSRKSETSTMVLVPLAVDALPVPVVAAGGIADRRAYRAALALGAEGVQLGTRLLASVESPASDKWKQAIMDCREGGTLLIPVGPLMMRVIATAEIQQELQKNPGLSFRFQDIEQANAMENGGLVPYGAGEVCALINDIRTVSEIISGIAG